ncbi:MAG: hypothetical protein ACRDNY_06445 [Gaiellaceae bacterium]
MLVSAGARFLVARSFDVPWITPDEMIYALVGESLWESGELSVRGIALSYYSLLTPALVGLPLTIDDLESGVRIAQALQALAMSFVAVPVYLWGKRLTRPSWALVAAALAVLPPALWYGGLLMTEALFYPLVTATLFALARMLEHPAVERQGVFLLLVSISAAVRLQALILLPALMLAVGVHAWFGRSTATIRRLTPVLGLVGAATVVLLTLYASGRSDLLGAYGELAEATPASTGVLAQLTWHGGAVVIMTLGLPLLATGTLAALAAWGTERDPAIRAFLAATTAYVVVLVAQVSAFAAGYLDHVGERYLITALPPLLLGLCVWVAQGGPRPARIAVPVALVSVALVATVPATRLATRFTAHDVLTLFPLVDLAERHEVGFRVGLVAASALMAVAFFLLPRRLLAVAPAAVALGFLVLSVSAAREIDRFSRIERARDLGTDVSPRWVDEAGAEPVALFDTGEQPSTSIARTAFWNRSIRQLIRLADVPPQALPQSPVRIRTDGALVDERDQEVSAPHVVLPTTITVSGERLASSPLTEIAPGSSLWRVDEPLRLVSRATGFTPVGDFSRAAVVVYRCGQGALELTLLGKDGLPVEISVNGFPWQTVELAAGAAWTGSVPSLAFESGDFPCLFELESAGLVGSTRVEWAPASGG